MAITGSKSFSVDTREIERMAKAVGQTELILREEMRVGMNRAGAHVVTAARARIKNRSGDLAKSGRTEVTLTGKTIEGRVRFSTPYARIVHDGRGPVVAKRAKALRFEIGGQVLFRKSVGPAKGTFFLERAAEETRHDVRRELERAADKIAKRVEAMI